MLDPRLSGTKENTMPNQLYFEDVTRGQEVTALTQHCDSQRLVYWAAGSGDFYQIHYDKDFAQRTGLPARGPARAGGGVGRGVGVAGLGPGSGGGEGERGAAPLGSPARSEERNMP